MITKEEISSSIPQSKGELLYLNNEISKQRGLETFLVTEQIKSIDCLCLLVKILYIEDIDKRNELLDYTKDLCNKKYFNV